MQRLHLVLTVILALIFSHLFAQVPKQLVEDDLQKWGQRQAVSPADLQDIRILSQHADASAKTHYIYVQQYAKGTPVEGGIVTMVYNQAHQVLHMAGKIWQDLDKLIVPTNLLGAEKATARALNHLGFSSHQRARQKDGLTINEQWIDHQGDRKLTYLVYVETPAQKVFRSVWVDAATGAILREKDRLLRCTPGDISLDHACLEKQQNLHTAPPSETAGYRVFPLGTESPLHGERTFLEDPSDKEASPLGWHDNDGIPGIDFTTSQGNNVYSQLGQIDPLAPAYYAEGGEQLQFDFDIDLEREPSTYLDASITNVYYWSNINHDIFHHYGFTEAAGNFQATNYSGTGVAGDQLIAHCQDQEAKNNALFSVREDGRIPHMFLFLWNNLLLDAALSTPFGKISAVESVFSRNNKLSETGSITGDLVLVEDTQPGTHLACLNNPIGNPDSLTGRIALIDRGTCFFVEKVLSAQQAGAIAVVVGNNIPGDPFPMGGVDHNITIPAILISQDEATRLKSELSANRTIEVTVQSDRQGPDLDSSLDNLIITHEYGHGISIRLTGGPSASGCLDNLEQMGEGWSDYFGLMLATDWQAAQAGSPRGIGTYLTRQHTASTGIRSFPYSTDLNINPMVYDDVPGSAVPHGLGAIWCSMLWDMTWNIIDEEGISTDLYKGTSGNNIALHLVMQGLKMQPCWPGFTDGRDAILKADSILYGGRHAYAIWKAFSGRGLGVEADQGDPNNVFDGISDYQMPEQFRTQISQFSADALGNEILINWQSEVIYDHQQFSLLRSTDQVNWQTITTLPGEEIVHQLQDYNYRDKEVIPGQLYHYQLIENTTRMQQRLLGSDSAVVIPFENMIIFPNPTRDLVQVRLDASISGPVVVNIYGMDGRKLRTWNLVAEDLHFGETFTLSDLMPGVYVLETSTENDTYRGRILLTP